MHNKILKEIISNRNKDKSTILTRFFKTGKGQYGEGDLFLGIVVPVSRKIAQKYGDIDFIDISELIKNKYHEVRLVAILILVHKYKKSKSEIEKKNIYNFYLKNTQYINNWDLVDLSAHYTIGDYLINKDPRHGGTSRNILLKLVKSKNIWERQIAIISTFAFIYKGEYEWTFRIVKLLINDKHDLIQKACGWMLREVGKRVSESELTAFLDEYSNQMPRTMLRYSIERLPEKKRLYYLHK